MMKSDLFISKKEQLKHWLRNKEFITTDEIQQWGIENYYVSALRRAQEFAEEGLIKRMDKDEKLFRGYNTKQGVFKWIN